MFLQPAKLSHKSLECFNPFPEVTSPVARFRVVNIEITCLDACRKAGILSLEIVFCAEVIRETSRFYEGKPFGVSSTVVECVV